MQTAQKWRRQALSYPDVHVFLILCTLGAFLGKLDHLGLTPAMVSFSSCSNPLRKGDPGLWSLWILLPPQPQVELNEALGMELHNYRELCTLGFRERREEDSWVGMGRGGGG